MTSGPRRSVGHMPGPTLPFSHPRPAGREVGAVDTTEQPVLGGMGACDGKNGEIYNKPSKSPHVGEFESDSSATYSVEGTINLASG